MIVDANGRAVRAKRTESPFPARLFEMLQSLSDVLAQQGVVLQCVRCGSPIQGRNHPSDPVYYLDCSCATRTFDRVKQLQKVMLRENVDVPIGGVDVSSRAH